MIVLAIVLGLAVVEVHAQEHGAKAQEHPAKAPEHGGKAEEPAPIVAPATSARSQRDFVALAERIHERVAEVTGASKGKAADQLKTSPEPRIEFSAASTRARVKLDWRLPLITWPEELLQPDAPSTR